MNEVTDCGTGAEGLLKALEAIGDDSLLRTIDTRLLPREGEVVRAFYEGDARFALPFIKPLYPYGSSPPQWTSALYVRRDGAWSRVKVEYAAHLHVILRIADISIDSCERIVTIERNNYATSPDGIMPLYEPSGEDLYNIHYYTRPN